MFMEDELCHDTGTLQGLAFMLNRSADLVSGKVSVVEDAIGPTQGGNISIWVAHGTEDRVTSFEATREWVESLDVKDKEFKIYDGWYHKREFLAFYSLHRVGRNHGNTFAGKSTGSVAGISPTPENIYPQRFSRYSERQTQAHCVAIL